MGWLEIAALGKVASSVGLATATGRVDAHSTKLCVSRLRREKATTGRTLGCARTLEAKRGPRLCQSCSCLGWLATTCLRAIRIAIICAAQGASMVVWLDAVTTPPAFVTPTPPISRLAQQVYVVYFLGAAVVLSTFL